MTLILQTFRKLQAGLGEGLPGFTGPCSVWKRLPEATLPVGTPTLSLVEDGGCRPPWEVGDRLGPGAKPSVGSEGLALLSTMGNPTLLPGGKSASQAWEGQVRSVPSPPLPPPSAVTQPCQ